MIIYYYNYQYGWEILSWDWDDYYDDMQLNEINVSVFMIPPATWNCDD